MDSVCDSFATIYEREPVELSPEQLEERVAGRGAAAAVR